ncbi:MAG: hypothetical protein PHX62_02100 [Bacilli bacterium]|nr:hypothetical protein [Bacilli bacterium]
MERCKTKIKKKGLKLAAKLVHKNIKGIKPRFSIRIRFYMLRLGHKMIHEKLIKDGFPETRDHIYWQEKGWFTGKKLWKSQTAFRQVL